MNLGNIKKISIIILLLSGFLAFQNCGNPGGTSDSSINSSDGDITPRTLPPTTHHGGDGHEGVDPQNHGNEIFKCTPLVSQNEMGIDFFYYSRLVEIPPKPYTFVFDLRYHSPAGEAQEYLSQTPWDRSLLGSSINSAINGFHITFVHVPDYTSAELTYLDANNNPKTIDFNCSKVDLP